MDELPGSLGTSASLALRFGQTIFSTASLLFMCLDVEFYSYTAFCYLVTVMGLVVPWGMTLVIVDAYFVFVRCLPRQPRIIIILIAGDLALSYLSLAAACSTASTTMLLHDADRSYCPAKLCTRYQLSAAMAFLSWFLSMGSCLFNLWLLPSL
ncbi:PREDICTED: CASP-like protein ARALYDRAFT_485429 isoform X1 [Fragaria vesca subsp. vesca]|uniref:CASP-like protein ARALYDRAFT_485429 isoform X1 n=1 Tax=Fragaria vesca subsp. vesca TaxID=101020 RepID=UPI0002C360CD|nr:PREDICTED: CASP-like protein ARALYDRAFT_485429 isoform X1 [Fragaria vesca subsp. vesca]